ncbi:hypothetical protein [Pseudomonas sp. PDM18]|uniref:hypothetical protein n=1 Tax=Pseudomonas sp. PDM18 TaxID=2769253 RepID=UPI001CE0979E|nr:hypothetical protein [Pseudomonas sp. PDM18]
MKKLLIAAVVASICTPVLAAEPGAIQPLESYRHKQGFYQSTEMRPILKPAVAETGTNTDAAAVGGGAAAAAVPAAGASLGLATPLVGSLTVGAAVGIGAAVVAVGAAVGNHGGGGHHSTSGTTGTTR